MKKNLHHGILISLFCLVLVACEKSGVQPTVNNSIFSSAKGRAAFVNSLADALQLNRNPGIHTESISGTKDKNPRFIALFSSWFGGVVIYDESGSGYEYAIFENEMTDKDFFRENPDGTISAHINWHNADATYFRYDFRNGVSITKLTGTGAKFSETLTGKLVEVTFENEGAIYSYYYFDINSGYGTYHMQGMGQVGPEGNAPWKTLTVKFVNTPSGALQKDLSLK